MHGGAKDGCDPPAPYDDEVADDEALRRRVYRAMAETVFLEPGDPRAVPLHQQRYGGDPTVDHDPVNDLATTVRWSTASSTMQLFSGFRGSGKTTELLRLREMLRDDGFTVLYIRLEDYLNVHEPVEPGSFHLAVLASMDDAARGESGDPGDRAPAPLLDGGGGVGRWWDRFKAVLTSRSETFEIGVKLGVVEFKTELRENPSFRQEVNAASARSLGAVKKEADAFTLDLAEKAGGEPGRGLVLLVDSLDHADNRAEFDALMTSIQALFERYSTLLELAGVHVIYTVPPYLRFIKTQCGPVRMLTTVKVAEPDGSVVGPGLDALTTLIARREPDWVRLLGSELVLHRLILMSGGHLRDLLRLVAGVAMHARSLPATPAVVDYTIDQHRNSLVADLSADEVAWLRRIAESHDASLETGERRGAFASLLDRHLVLGYLNGEEWYDVHPLARLAAGLEERKPPANT